MQHRPPQISIVLPQSHVRHQCSSPPKCPTFNSTPPCLEMSLRALYFPKRVQINWFLNEVNFRWTSLIIVIQARIQKVFKRGGGRLRRKILKEKCLLIQVSPRVHVKTRQTCNSFSLLPFQEDFLLYSYFLLILEIWKGGCNPRNPPLDPPNCYFSPDNVIFELGGSRAWSDLMGTKTCAPPRPDYDSV